MPRRRIPNTSPPRRPDRDFVPGMLKKWLRGPATVNTDRPLCCRGLIGFSVVRHDATSCSIWTSIPPARSDYRTPGDQQDPWTSGTCQPLRRQSDERFI